MVRNIVLALTLCVPVFVHAQQTPAPAPSEPPATTAPPAAATPPRSPFGNASSQDPQPYEKVITKDAKSSKGIFTVHQIKDKYYYEIPKEQYAKLFLLNTRIAKTAIGAGNGGQELSSRVVYWELNGNKINLRSVSYDIVADPKAPIAEAVKASNNNAILMSFPVAAFGPFRNSAVIEVSRLFTSDVSEFSARQRLNATTMDATRSYIERISPYPENMEAEATHTYTRMPRLRGCQSDRAAWIRPRRHAPGQRDRRPAPQHGEAARQSHDAAPVRRARRIFLRRADGLQPRRTARAAACATSRAGVWRRKIPTAALSEPVKPIVYYIDSATPTKWVPWIKRGVENWQPAFEAAGFKNAIIAKAAPTPQQDPDFSPEDVRYSVIRWLPSTIENAIGPAHLRSAHRRDSQRRHSVLSQRDEPGSATGISCRWVRSIRARKSCRCRTT